MPREISRKNLVKEREQFILDKCMGKNVLHLGCCNTPYTEFVFNKGTALFQRIDRVCNSQLGLDIDQSGLDFMSSIGHDNVLFFDLNNPGIVNFVPDVIIFADTLEHLMNLEIALSSLKSLMNEAVELVITVPNATMFERMIGNFKGSIHEHPDHKVSFTYTALKQLLKFNELDVIQVLLSDKLHTNQEIQKPNDFTLKDFVLSPIRIAKNLTRNILVNFFPLFSECLIVVCKVKKI